MERERNQQVSQTARADGRPAYRSYLIPELIRLASDSRTIYLTGFDNPREQAVEALRTLGIEEDMQIQLLSEDRERGGETR